MTTIRSIATLDPETVPSTASIGFVLGRLEVSNIRHLPVVDGDGTLVGIVSDRDVRAWRQAWQDLVNEEGDNLAENLLARPVAQLMTSPVRTAAPDAPIGEVAARMFEDRISAVVLAEQGKPIGIATSADMLRALADVPDEAFAPVTVADWMTESVFSVLADDPVDEALGLMLEQEVRHLPVVDDEGALIGIVSHRDILAEGTMHELVADSGEVGARLRSLADLRVGEVMAVAETATRDMTLAEAAATLIEHGYGCLPVVDNRILVGILTEADFVRHTAKGPR